MSTKSAPGTPASIGREDLKTERVHARLTPATKALVQEASALSGRAVSDFMVDAAREKALATVEAHRVWSLSSAQSEVFARAILDPLPPSPSMVARYRAYLERGGKPFASEDEPGEAVDHRITS